jgi:diguanylate cyclase (GGDEF)-like protein
MITTVVIGAAGAIVPGLRHSTEAIRPLLIAMFAIVLTAVVVVRARQYPPGWIFLAGSIGLACSVGYRAIRTFAGTPFLDRWAFEVGSIVDALLFAIAIIVRLRFALLERQAIERRLTQATHDAMHDDLTGVLNRRGLFAQADQLQSGTLFAIDLDAFKAINDRYGHAAGDRVLLAVAQQLRASVRADDLVARIGGDEFVIVAPRTDLNGAKAVAERITTAVESIRAIGVRTRADGFGASIGYVALDGLAFENALRLADTHAYRIKESRRAARRQRSGT